MSRWRGADRPHPETVALARARAAAGASLVGGSDAPPEVQVHMLKGLCRHLWGLLDRRRGDTAPADATDPWGDLTDFGRAAVDQAFEAAMILWSRDGIHVEPCRRILDAQLDGGRRYVLAIPGAPSRAVSEAELMTMAGLA